MLSSIVLVSPIQQCKSAIIIRISPPSHSHRPQVVAELRAGLPVLPSCLFSAWQCTYVCATFSICSTLSPPHCVYEFILYICVSVPSLQIGSSIPSF